MKPKKTHFGEVGQIALRMMICPYCEADLEGYLFGGSDGREGGLSECSFCNVRFAWIDDPFDCEIQEEGQQNGKAL